MPGLDRGLDVALPDPDTNVITYAHPVTDCIPNRLANHDTFGIADGELTLTTPDDETLTFKEAEPFTLSGSSWTITAYNNGKEAVTSPIADSELTLEFVDDKSVAGSGGVNQFNGGYTATEDTIEIGPLATTKMMGPEDLMAQEQAYIAALEAAASWEVANGLLTMRDADDAMQITATKK